MSSTSSDRRHAAVNHSNRPSAVFLNCRPFLTEKLRPSGRERRQNSIQDLSVRTCTSSPARRRAVPGYLGLGPPDFVPHSIFGLRAVESRQFKFEKASRYATKVVSFLGPRRLVATRTSVADITCLPLCLWDRPQACDVLTTELTENFYTPSQFF